MTIVRNMPMNDRDKIFNDLIRDDRIGQFEINPNFLAKYSAIDALKIMSNFIVTNVDYNNFGRNVVYTAFSPLFDRCTEGYKPPMYKLEIETQNVQGVGSVVKNVRDNYVTPNEVKITLLETVKEGLFKSDEFVKAMSEAFKLSGCNAKDFNK